MTVVYRTTKTGDVYRQPSSVVAGLLVPCGKVDNDICSRFVCWKITRKVSKSQANGY